jgi:hypothetical protein
MQGDGNPDQRAAQLRKARVEALGRHPRPHNAFSLSSGAHPADRPTDWAQRRPARTPGIGTDLA